MRPVFIGDDKPIARASPGRYIPRIRKPIMKFAPPRIVAALSIVLAGFTAKAADPHLNLNHTGAEASVELSGDAGTEYLLESASGSAENWKPITAFILSDPSRLWMD